MRRVHTPAGSDTYTRRVRNNDHTIERDEREIAALLAGLDVEDAGMRARVLIALSLAKSSLSTTERGERFL
jgi:hypothetical protein